jgi:2-dehydropantoate 2-reductase
MNIVIFGAGAIGTLFGALLARKNKVILIGRAPHITGIQTKGLTIKGKTRLSIKVTAVESTKDIPCIADLILLTVKSYDTETASEQLLSCIGAHTLVLSIQNGLDNIEKIGHIIEKNHIIAGVTTHGAMVSQPGVILHTGKGKTILGELDGCQSERLTNLVDIFNEAGIETKLSGDILKDIWVKTIINSSINPLTAFFGCNNGYLVENPLLEKIVECICTESALIASSAGILVSPIEMIEKTKEVIRNTSNNYSSMLQSIQQGKKTEIDSINGTLTRIGAEHHIDTSLNSILTELINSQ